MRRFRGRLGGAVSLWTAGDETRRAGLTVSSLMVANGDPARVLGLLDPDSDLVDVLGATGRALVHLLEWPDRDLAEAFAGTAPAPGGPFRAGTWERTGHGPLLAGRTHARVRLVELREMGWSLLAVTEVEAVEVVEETAALEHRRGRYHRVAE